MPMNQVLLRGIPPDKHNCNGHSVLAYNIYPIHHHTLQQECPELTGTHEFRLNAIELNNSSMIFTSAPDIETLFHNLTEQLFYEGKITKLAFENLNNFLLSQPKTCHTPISNMSIPSIEAFNYISSDPSRLVLLNTHEHNNYEKFHTHTQHTLINPNEPLCQGKNTKQLSFTTRLLYPRTRLPLVLPSPPNMPAFKNRLHYYHALKKMFDDVNITQLSDENAIILHQRCFSIAKHPRAPGYHINAVSGDKARSDLQTFYSEVEQELHVEKTRTPAANEKENDDFRYLIEIARSLIPEGIELTHDFPINCLLGLTRDVASDIIKNYHEKNNISKSAAFYRRRDTAFFIHHIFVILDKIYSTHALVDPSHDTEDGHSESPKEPVAPIVTPLPTSPGKRRSMNDNTPLDSNDADMEDEANNLLLDEMNLLTWDEVYEMSKESVMTFISAYASYKKYLTSSKITCDDDIEDLRETLLIYIIELHVERSTSGIYKNTADRFIDEMEPIWAYFEYYRIFMADANSDVSLVLLLELEDVKKELKSARDQLAMMVEEDFEHDSVESFSDDECVDTDVHMFYPGFEENDNVNEEHKVVNTMFLNTVQFHKDNNTMDSEDMDRDLMSIIGIMTKDAVDMISINALCFLLRSFDRLAGDIFELSHYHQRDDDNLRKEFHKAHTCMTEFRTQSGKIVPPHIQNLGKRDLRFINKQFGQIF